MVDKPYMISDKCANCKHNVYEYNMWLCLHHQIDVEEYDLDDGCDAFEEGTTVSFKYKLKQLRKSLKKTIEFSKKIDKKQNIEYSFLLSQIEGLADDKFVFDNIEE